MVANRSEIVQMMEVVANEKDIPLEDIFVALEAALAMAISKRTHFAVRVVVDRNSGDYKIFRQWEIVPDTSYVGESSSGHPLPFDAELHITLDDTKVKQSGCQVGEFIEEPMESVGLGRIAAQTAKQVILQKVREAERAQVAEAYRDLLGQLVTGVVKSVTRDYAIIDLGDNAEAVLPHEEMLPHESVRINDRIRCYLFAIRPEVKGPQLFVSRACKEMLVELFRLEVPEVNEDIIEIKAAARIPGVRSKIAVKTNDGRIDPIGACIGMRGVRVQAVSNELGGERVDVILWDDNAVQFVINAMAPAEVASIVIDEDNHTMDIIVQADQLSQAIGRSGQNIRLASDLSEWTLNVMTVEEQEEKSKREIASVTHLFVEALDVDEEFAEMLANEGFISLEEVAYVAEKELLAVEGLDKELVAELQNRAKEALMAQGGGKMPSKELLEMEGMTPELARKLAAHGVIMLDDLAEQSVDDLLSLVEIDSDAAAKLIMKAREPWFSDNKDD